MRRRMSRTKAIFLIVAVILSLCAVTGSAVLAKYYSELGSANGVVGAKNFYFTSNFLDGAEHTLAPGSTSVTFSLGNNADDLRFSEADISYTVKVTNGATVTTGSEGTLSGGAVSYAEVTINGLTAGKTYEVTAKGTGGYQKTLTATIKVPQKTAKLYWNQDSSSGVYTVLTVWNEGDAAGEVEITYTGIPDNTNPNMDGWTTGTTPTGVTKTVSVPSHSSLVFRFFGTTPIGVANAEQKELY